MKGRLCLRIVNWPEKQKQLQPALPAAGLMKMAAEASHSKVKDVIIY